MIGPFFFFFSVLRRDPSYVRMLSNESKKCARNSKIDSTLKEVLGISPHLTRGCHRAVYDLYYHVYEERWND